MLINEVCRDVKHFLSELARELPEIFPVPRPAIRPARPRRLVSTENASRKTAKDIICARVQYWGAALNLEYGRVFIKDQRTLWGSCSGRRNLNFNWHLAAAPPEVLDYVVIHELCHLREMNHSKKFWGLVAAICPDYAARRKWLRDNSALLRSMSSGAGFNLN
jgi:predicted metal-dependent hydrolase